MLLFSTQGRKPFQYLSCGKLVSEEPFLHSARQLDNFVLLLGSTGEMRIACAEQEYVLKPGSILLLPPDIPHHGVEPSGPMLSYFWCHFNCETPYRLLASESPEAQTLFDHPASDAILLPVHTMIRSADRPLLIFQQMMHIAYAQYRCHYAADYALNLLMTELSEQCGHPSQLVEHNTAKISEIAEWIRINLNRSLTVQGVADKFNYSADYLSALFRKHMGTSIVRYIRNLRISQARELLLHTQKQIQEIAHDVGYDDEKYFMRQFKAVENMSPSAFRNAYSRKHMNNK